MKCDVTLVRSYSFFCTSKASKLSPQFHADAQLLNGRFFCTSKASKLTPQFHAGAQLLNGKKVSMAAADAMRARAAAQREKEDRLVLSFFFNSSCSSIRRHADVC
jgi:hypothetical protein